tara:strand:+ start:5906 stop:6523 length:618 start_codon:yes stop_codon:yes gene_type:complete
MNKTIIKCSNVSYYDNGSIILKNINLSIYFNEITAIIGPNGSGKTTLLKILFGLINQSSGTIIRNFNLGNASFIFQKHVFLNMTVTEILNHALFCKGVAKNARTRIIRKATKKYNLESFKDKSIKLLSGGEQQIIALIRSLILNPMVLFYDEPLNNLDKYSSDYIIDILQDLHDNDVQLLIVTHDSYLLEKLKCKTVEIRRGAII